MRRPPVLLVYRTLLFLLCFCGGLYLGLLASGPQEDSGRTSLYIHVSTSLGLGLILVGFDRYCTSKGKPVIKQSCLGLIAVVIGSFLSALIALAVRPPSLTIIAARLTPYFWALLWISWTLEAAMWIYVLKYYKYELQNAENQKGTSYRAPRNVGII
ncbi:hypothetical protein BC832DRAFT_616816 [Gaertneriomyces semiglobifer]|nr:hypothetical protein BC832DRAFT_616816 [Gaertneriomyces semiglobifer]